MQVLENACLVTMAAGDEGVMLLADGAIVTDGERIAWVGERGNLPARYRDLPARDLGGRLVTPGLIDCHTHVVYGGDRATEFEMRLEGASYEEIARAGGGILSTVAATRAADADALLALALPRVDALLREGVTTLEVKSGYGLDIETEMRMLRVARAIGRLRPVNVVTTWLAAHALPPEYREDRAAYLDGVVIAGMTRAHEEGLVDAVDGFCETIGFTLGEMERVFAHAGSLGLPVKLHAEQLSDQHGAAMAARMGAISADHLEYLGEDGIAAMAAAGTVAVLLPGAFYTLREAQLPPVEALRKARVPIALATDCNPGTSPMASILLTMNMGATLFRLTPAECLRGVTLNAARALGLGDRGVIEAGARADLAIWDVARPAELSWRIGWNPLHARIFGGQFV